jgi:hypothetical protein
VANPIATSTAIELAHRAIAAGLVAYCKMRLGDFVLSADPRAMGFAIVFAHGDSMSLRKLLNALPRLLILKRHRVLPVS